MATDRDKHPYPWMALKRQPPSSRQPEFLRADDEEAMQRLREKTGNTDLSISMWFSETAELSAPRSYRFHFHIASPDLETTRIRALEILYYITDHFGVPEDCIDIIFNGGGQASSHVDHDSAGAGGNDVDGLMENAGQKLGIDSDATGQTADRHDSPGDQADAGDKAGDYEAVKDVASSAEIVVSIPPVVFSGQPRAEDSMISPQEVPEAVEWFAGLSADFEKKQRRQDDLRKAMLQEGWEILPCLRRLTRLCLYDHVRLEAYRTISRFLSWIGAGESEIRYQIHSIDHRNPIKDYQKLKNIVIFAIENPWFFGCEHALLSQFCPAGGCFMAEALEKHEKPYLFEQV